MRHVICIGAGPAGLTAAYFLTQAGWPVTVLEKDATYVGGIARTVQYKGYRFDIGGHRFFSKSKEIEDLWKSILGPDLLTRPRKSRIYYRGKFFPYPLRIRETLKNIGAIEAALCIMSYGWRRICPHKPENNFEAWIANRFGDRLYRMFFKTYTEKVWGMPCREISTDWAAQRISGFSLGAAIFNALIGRWYESGFKTQIKTFHYPRLGPGMMWERTAEEVQKQGGKLLMNTAATELNYDKQKRKWQVSCNGGPALTADCIISSLPMRQLVQSLGNQLPQEAHDAAAQLRYRDFLIVALIVRGEARFDDQWIYIHDPGVQVGRIQNFRAWSPEMVPVDGTTCYGMEYFCFDGDGLWNSSDDALIRQATAEIVKLGLAKAEDILDGHVVRQQKAYPVYDEKYEAHVGVIRNAIGENCPDLYLAGRNGMHKYNNQDHSMMTAWLTARNLLAGKDIYDVWQVNQDAEYHESKT